MKTIELQTLTSNDFTWDATNLGYWFMTENYTVIIAACIPTLRPLFIRKNSSTVGQSGRPMAKQYVAYGSDRSRGASKGVQDSWDKDVGLRVTESQV